MSLARTSDISTSHAAAAVVVASGTQRIQQIQAAAAVKLHPGLTSLQLSKATGLDRHMLGRRLPELLKSGSVYRGPSVSEPGARAGCTWWPVAPGDNYTLAV